MCAPFVREALIDPRIGCVQWKEAVSPIAYLTVS
eukprot:UN10513